MPELPRVPAPAPAPRSLTAHVADGFPGVLRVLTVLHSRRCAVTSVQVAVGDGDATSRVHCSLMLTLAQHGVLREQLRRIPAVLSADCR